MGNRKSLKLIMLRIAFWPMILMSLIIVFAGSYFVAQSIEKQVELGMKNVNGSVVAGLNAMYPGLYSYEEKEDGLYFYKGDHEFNWDFDYIDAVKTCTGCDITICYMNVAVITTLENGEGDRLVGCMEDEKVFSDLKNHLVPVFIKDAYLNGKKYYSYYSPLYGSDNEVIGMISVAEPAAYASTLVREAITPILLIALLAIIITSIIVISFSNQLISIIRKIQKYMKSISEEDFRAQIDPMVEKRTDELGEMSKSAASMAASLRKKVEEDQLTGLYNRRSADKMIRKTIINYVDKGVNYCLALGDIDFFKKINDTYGHEAGDVVLETVATTFKNFMIGKGYAIRWGGEEFILVFEDTRLEEAKKAMNELMDEIRGKIIISGDYEIRITMTFGIVECKAEDHEDIPSVYGSKEDASKDIEGRNEIITSKKNKYISKADKLLYYGKENGRNRLVSEDMDEVADCVKL